jgi:hypothetical protein
MKTYDLLAALAGIAAILFLDFTVPHVNPAASTAVWFVIGTLWAGTLRRRS